MQGRPSRVVVAILRQLPKVDVAVLQFMMVVHGHSDLLHCDYQEVGTRGTRGTRGTSEEHLDFGDGVARSRPAEPKKEVLLAAAQKTQKTSIIIIATCDRLGR